MIRKPIYRIQFQNFEEFTVTITISDMEDYDPFLTEFYYVDLQASETPLKLITGVNEEDSLYGIFTTQAVIQFEATDEIGMHTFLGGEMNRWKVLIDGPGFQGYLLADGMEEPFMRKRTTTLIAVQNLGLLKDIPLTGFSGERLSGRYSLAKIVAMCLYKAGLEIVINIADNLFEKEHEDRSIRSWNSPYDQTYVDILTYEKEINELKDCYTVLTEIVTSRFSRLFIHNGEYWIVRTDEYINSTLTYTRFSYLGEISATENEPVSVVKLIGSHSKGFDVFPINEDAVAMARDRYKEIRLTYDYQYPKEIPSNKDFLRGDLLSPIDAGPASFAYDLEDWTFEAGEELDRVATVGDAYIRRKFDNGYEVERYAVIPQPVDFDYQWIRSAPIPLTQGDKFEFSADFKYNIDWGGMNERSQRMMFVFVTLDGTKYGYGLDYGSIGGLNGRYDWHILTDVVSPESVFVFTSWTESNQNEKEYQTLSTTVTPVPGDGDLYIKLMSSKSNGLVSTTEINYSNLQFTYIPLIDGTYHKFQGERFTVSQSGNYAKRDESKVYLGDATGFLFKGAMMRYLFPEGIEYTGLNITSSPNAIAVIGDNVSTLYFAGDKIKLTGTTLNDKIFTIESVTILSTSHIEIYPVEDLVTEVILGDTEISVGYLTLTEGWNDKIVNELSMTDERAVKWFLYDRFQQGRSVSSYFDFTLQGLDAGETNQCGIIHKYRLEISNPLTNNRFFLVLRFEQDWHKCEWTASFVEGFYTANERTYGFDFTHKYIEQ